MIELIVVAQLLDCHPTPEGLNLPIAWRMVEGRKCWYTGPRKHPKEQLRLQPLRSKPSEQPSGIDTLHPRFQPTPIDSEFEMRWRALEDK